MFMNKLDCDGCELLDLLNEVEEVFGIEIYLMNWLMGMGKGLKGLYDCYNYCVEFYYNEVYGEMFLLLDENGEFDFSNELIKDSIYCDMLDEVELINEVGNDFDEVKVMVGDMMLVFFGFVFINFGVEMFLKMYLQYVFKFVVYKICDD